MIFEFIVLLSSLARVADLTKCLFLNDEPCMVRPTIIDMNPVNVLSPKICVPKKTKDINVKAFNRITNKDEAKAMTEHISCDCKRKFDSITCNSKQKWNNKTCQCGCKNFCKCKENYSWNPSTYICENSKYSKSITDTTVTEYDEIIIVTDILSTKNTNTIATNVTSNMPVTCYMPVA